MAEGPIDSEVGIADPSRWLSVALAELADHVREIPGDRHAARILEYHKATTLGAQADEVPWCSSFVNWVMQKSGLPSTRSAMARSWLQYGQPTTERFGAIAVLARGVPGSNQGHVGFYCGRQISSILVLGGNQSNAVTLERFHVDRVIGWRWPKGVAAGG